MYYKGTGKSFVADVIHEVIRDLFGNENDDSVLVAVLAPTGLAAYNINGMTIHSCFKLPVQHGTEQMYYELHDADIKTMRLVLSKVKLIIIGNFKKIIIWYILVNLFIILDEISMVSSVMLAQIHNRLNEIFPNDKFSFGNQNILVFGDLLQVIDKNYNDSLILYNR